MTVLAWEFAVVDEMGNILICEPSFYAILEWLEHNAPTFYAVYRRDYGTSTWYELT